MAVREASRQARTTRSANLAAVSDEDAFELSGHGGVWSGWAWSVWSSPGWASPGWAWSGWQLHHCRPDGEADRFVTLVEAVVLERHDAGGLAGTGTAGPPGRR